MLDLYQIEQPRANDLCECQNSIHPAWQSQWTELLSSGCLDGWQRYQNIFQAQKTLQEFNLYFRIFLKIKPKLEFLKNNDSYSRYVVWHIVVIMSCYCIIGRTLTANTLGTVFKHFPLYGHDIFVQFFLAHWSSNINSISQFMSHRMSSFLMMWQGKYYFLCPTFTKSNILV